MKIYLHIRRVLQTQQLDPKQLALQKQCNKLQSSKQLGAAAVEFALIIFILFTLLFGIIELGRLFYIWNTVQEVTRNAARLAVVSWPVTATEINVIKNQALFGGSALPAGAEVNNTKLSIEYYRNYSDAVANNNSVTLSGTATENMNACLTSEDLCVRFVKVMISGVQYVPMIGLFQGTQFGPNILPDLRITVPGSSVVMPTESMGFIPPAT